MQYPKIFDILSAPQLIKLIFDLTIQSIYNLQKTANY